MLFIIVMMVVASTKNGAWLKASLFEAILTPRADPGKGENWAEDGAKKRGLACGTKGLNGAIKPT